MLAIARLKVAVQTTASRAMGFPVKRWRALYIQGIRPFAAHAPCSGRPQAIAQARFARHQASGASREKINIKTTGYEGFRRAAVRLGAHARRRLAAQKRNGS
jgi:hypothetical protein